MPKMRVTNIALGDDEMPAVVTVEMTADVAARVLKTFGAMTPVDAVISEIYSCLAGSLFNRFYDGGVDDFLEKK